MERTTRSLHAPRPRVAVIGAGTGLGEAIVMRATGKRVVVPSEGGHSDFAARNELEIDFLRYMIAKYGRVSYERVLSGPGFAAKKTGKKAPQKLQVLTLKIENLDTKTKKIECTKLEKAVKKVFHRIVFTKGILSERTPLFTTAFDRFNRTDINHCRAGFFGEIAEAKRHQGRIACCRRSRAKPRPDKAAQAG